MLFKCGRSSFESHRAVGRSGGEGAVCGRGQVEVLDKSLQQCVGLLTRQVEEADGELIEVSPTFDVLVVQVVVYAAVGLERVCLNRSHSADLFKQLLITSITWSFVIKNSRFSPIFLSVPALG